MNSEIHSVNFLEKFSVCILVCIFWVPFNFVAAQHGSNSLRIVPNMQKLFIENILDRYSQPKKWFQGNEVQVIKYDRGGGTEGFKCKLKDSLILLLPSGERVLCYLHSSHQAEQIGDITLAICTDGTSFLHKGHICGGILSLVSKPGTSINSAQDFFRYMIDDVNDKPWEKLDAKNQP